MLTMYSHSVSFFFKFIFVHVLDTGVSGHTLNITRVNRVHMGQYKCLADNGIPPQASQTFNLEVYCKFNNNNL